MTSARVFKKTGDRKLWNPTKISYQYVDCWPKSAAQRVSTAPWADCKFAAPKSREIPPYHAHFSDFTSFTTFCRHHSHL